MPTSPPRRKTRRLPARLSAIAERLPDTGVVCDVGSDHGLLPLYLLDRNPKARAVVTDIKPSPLARARAALEEGGVSDRAACVLTDGIAGLSGYRIDCFVIAGMSGETIAGILREGREILRPGQRLFLQPMSHEDLLRAYLSPEGFRVTEEVVIKENGKLFLLLCVSFTGEPEKAPDPVDAALGSYLDKHPGEWGRAYLEAKRDRLRQTAKKRRAAGRDDSEQRQILSRIDELLKE